MTKKREPRNFWNKNAKKSNNKGESISKRPKCYKKKWPNWIENAEKKRSDFNKKKTTEDAASSKPFCRLRLNRAENN